MNSYTTVVKARFRARGYDDEDRDLIRREFGAFGAVRLSPEWPPEAGGSYELAIAIEFVGLAFLTGIVGHIAGRFYERVADSLRRLFQAKRQKGGHAPELRVTLSYDDLDIELAFVDETGIEKIPNLIGTIDRALRTPQIRDLVPTRVIVPMALIEARWEADYDAFSAPFDGRYWGVVALPELVVTHLYDSAEGRLVPLLPR